MQFSYTEHTLPVRRTLSGGALVLIGAGMSGPLRDWLLTPGLRHQRRFLDEHRVTLGENALESVATFISTRELSGPDRVQLLNDLDVLRRSARKAFSGLSPRDIYIDVYGAFAVRRDQDESELEEFLGTALDEGRRLYTGGERVSTLTEALSDDRGLSSRNPLLAAELRMHLAVAFVENTTAERRYEAFEEGIATIETALPAFPPGDFPRQHARAHCIRAGLYLDRLIGNLPDNYELALESCNDALAHLQADEHPIGFADATTWLAYVLQYRRRGERRANQEQAISLYERALGMFIELGDQHQQARCLMLLSSLYWQRVMGTRPANIEQAVSLLAQTAQIWDKDEYPIQRARLNHNFALMHLNRRMGSADQNRETAIGYAQRALATFQAEQFPVQHGQGLLNLSAMYQQRKISDRTENLNTAVRLLESALKIRTFERFPNEYAVTQSALGSVLADRAATGDLDGAQRAYREALRAWNVWTSPRDTWTSQLRLAELSAELADWQSAADAYRAALECQDVLVAAATGAVGRDMVLAEGRDAATRLGYILYRLGRPLEAAVAIERGRAKALTEAILADSADPLRITSQALRVTYLAALARLRATQLAINTSDSTQLENDRREGELARMADFDAARNTFNETIEQIRVAGDPGDFMDPALDANTILNAPATVSSGHCLVYLLPTPWGGLALASLPDPERGHHLRTLDLPQLTDALMDRLSGSSVEDDDGRVIGGYALAQTGSGLAQIQRDWPAASLQSATAKLADAHEDDQAASTLLLVLQDCLADSDLAGLTDVKLAELPSDDAGYVAEVFAAKLLRREVEACLAILSDVVMKPLYDWLRSYQPKSLSIVPCGVMAAFPLTAAHGDQDRPFGDLLATAIIPNARALANRRPAFDTRQGAFAVGNPSDDLPWSAIEAQALVALARNRFSSAEARVSTRARRDWLVDVLGRGEIVGISGHAVFEPDDVLRSAINLAGGEQITLAELISDSIAAKGLRLLILSSCQTAVLDTQGARDEVRSIAAGMLQAGPRAVLGSLWPVDDLATFALMTRFVQEWLPTWQDEPPAPALSRAQSWLRSVTNDDLHHWQDDLARLTGEPALAYEAPGMATRRAQRHQRGLRASHRAPATAQQPEKPPRTTAAEPGADRPFEQPLYWAGFQILGW